LKRLNTDYVDLYQIHWKDENTPLQETMRVLSHIVDMDYARYIGESNHPTQDIVEAMHISEKNMLHPFVTMQEPYNIIDRAIESEKIRVAQRYHLGILAYVPLAQGILSGKYLSGSGGRSDYYPQKVEYAKKNEHTVKKIVDFSRKKGITPSQLAIAWLIRRSDQIGVPVIPLLGITNEKYLDENLAATEVSLSNEDMKEIESFTKKEE
ncbi:MAG: aldo/keto reductase, partial [Thermoplasmata archaeon]